MIFNQPGSYPGIPGTFANCRVEVDEAGNVQVFPLALHPAEAAIDAVMSEPQGDTQPELPAITAPVAVAQETTVVQEQTALEPAPYLNGG